MNCSIHSDTEIQVLMVREAVEACSDGDETGHVSRSNDRPGAHSAAPLIQTGELKG